jgi:uncharacterized NAD(P)/FAD-binding protein YdhS
MPCEVDLVIAGAGAAGTHVLAALAQRKHSRIRRIAVLEAGADPGPGLAYGEAADPLHTLGRVPWRRRDKGNLLRGQLASSIATLRERGVIVELFDRCPARSLDRRGGAWVIESPRATVEAPRCVLATGHWHVHALAGIERAVDWRWDVRRLAIRDDEDVVVLGASQSAIDVAIALAARRSWRGRIALASRTGLLPRVWGHLGPSRHSPGGARRLDGLRGGSPRLADVVAATRADLDAAGASWDELLAPRGNGIAVLCDDVSAALASRATKREIPWQSVLWPTVPAVFDVFPQLPAEDRLAIVPHTYTALRHLEAIHVANARRIVKLAAAGRLRAAALGGGIAIREDATGVVAEGSLGEVRGHRIVDARGHDPHIAHSDDAFLRTALAAGHVHSARIAYAERDGYLETGGIWVDPRTFRVQGTDDLFALGPLAMGQLPVYLGLWALRREAAAIASELGARAAADDEPGAEG